MFYPSCEVFLFSVVLNCVIILYMPLSVVWLHVLLELYGCRIAFCLASSPGSLIFFNAQAWGGGYVPLTQGKSLHNYYFSLHAFSLYNLNTHKYIALLISPQLTKRKLSISLYIWVYICVANFYASLCQVLVYNNDNNSKETTACESL